MMHPNAPPQSTSGSSGLLGQTSRWKIGPRIEAHGLRLAGLVERSGLAQSGPRPVSASGTLIIAKGPARCSPMHGVGLVASKPHAAASCGLLNQTPTWKVLVGGRLASGSNPKIWSSRTVLTMATPAPAPLASRSAWYQAIPKWKPASPCRVRSM